jgi:hypothetical protein
MEMQLDREFIAEVRSLLAYIHGDKGQHTAVVGLTQSVKDALSKLDEGTEIDVRIVGTEVLESNGRPYLYQG